MERTAPELDRSGYRASADLELLLTSPRLRRAMNAWWIWRGPLPRRCRECRQLFALLRHAARQLRRRRQSAGAPR